MAIRSNGSISLITQNEEMQRQIRRIDKVVDSATSILLIGETGVGKEIFADYIHHLSDRGQNSFVKISLAAMPAELLESELFGFDKGSFTNADHEKKGLFEIANGGTLFLDDIDDTPLNIQAKLLRVLESHQIRHIGGSTYLPVDVRLICASKVELKDLIEKRLFRQDLFYRINTVEIRIPPLRDRKEDIPLLIDHFVKHYAPKKDLSIHSGTLSLLMEYHWPGNVRELRNVIQRAALFADNEIKISDLPDELTGFSPLDQIVKACSLCFTREGMPYNDVISCVESRLLSEAISQADGNQSKAAQLLGMKLSTFRDKVQKYNLH